MEDENAWAALQNNTLGTYHAAIAAAEADVERFVLISTDKAVNPTSIMGASKRAAEMVLSQLATRGHATVFSAVRFGNVLGSSGSVIPKFKEQIARGGPVTVTHPEITRFFMTVSEAARLVIQAAALAQTGQVWVLYMGEPVRIVELAQRPDTDERDTARTRSASSSAACARARSSTRNCSRRKTRRWRPIHPPCPGKAAGARCGRRRGPACRLAAGRRAHLRPQEACRIVLRETMPEYAAAGQGRPAPASLRIVAYPAGQVGKT